MKWVERAKTWFKRNKGKEVAISSKDTAEALVKVFDNVEINTEEPSKVGQLEPKIIAKDKVAKKIDEELSVVIDGGRVKIKPKKMAKKVLDVLKSYGLSDNEAKRYLRYKYILKHTKSGRIRDKAFKNIVSCTAFDEIIGINK